MSKYKDGKIYQIKSNISESNYVGSTIWKLNNRLAKHKTDYRKGNGPYLKILYDEVGMDNCTIELIEDYPCENRGELLKREQYWIDTMRDICVNKNRAFASEEDIKEMAKRHSFEYRNRHPDRIKLYEAEYRKKNGDIIKGKARIRRIEKKDEIKAYMIAYNKKNKDRINARRRELARIKRENK